MRLPSAPSAVLRALALAAVLVPLVSCRSTTATNTPTSKSQAQLQADGSIKLVRTS